MLLISTIDIYVTAYTSADLCNGNIKMIAFVRLIEKVWEIRLLFLFFRKITIIFYYKLENSI